MTLLMLYIMSVIALVVLASLGSAAWPARARAARQGAFVAERNDPVSFTLEQSNQPVSLAATRNV